MEGLVKAGSFDVFKVDRNSLLNSIPKLIQVNKSLWEEKTSNQSSLFSSKNNEEESIFKINKLKPWSKNETLMNEFYSIGFYMSDHPINMYKDFFNESRIRSFNEFIESSDSNSLVAGTIMSIQEKKSSKGTPFAIIKFSDLKSEFELFIFSEQLILNREKLKAANSFVLTLQKDTAKGTNLGRRINVKNILPLDDFVKKSYEKVVIEINNNSNLKELQSMLNETGETNVQIKIKKNSKTYLFSLKKPRKFNFNTFKNLRNVDYVKKISF